MPQPCIPFDAKRPLNCRQHLYAALGGESASNSNIHRDQTSPGILMDAALDSVDGSRCVMLQYVNSVSALAVKMVTELPVECVMSFYCSV